MSDRDFILLSAAAVFLLPWAMMGLVTMIDEGTWPMYLSLYVLFYLGLRKARELDG